MINRHVILEDIIKQTAQHHKEARGDKAKSNIDYYTAEVINRIADATTRPAIHYLALYEKLKQEPNPSTSLTYKTEDDQA